MTSSGVLTIDLAAICENWLRIQGRASSGVEAGAVVKANAYGLGAAQISHALFAVGCRHFFVATKEEAFSLRSLLPDSAKFIMLGGVRKGDERLVAEAGFIPVLYSNESLARWLACCESQRQAFPCVLKIDTGMTRLGMSISELELVAANPGKYLNPVLLMSHLACSEQVDHPLNFHQLTCFRAAAAIFQSKFPNTKLSLANSSGVFLGQDWHFDLLRPGAALYGINPTPGVNNPMKPVVHLALPVLQVRELDTAVAVGYGASYQAQPGSKLIVVAGGYADGLHRTLGQKPVAHFADLELGVAGRISMDSIVFELAAAERSVIAPGDYLEVINETLSLDYLMQKNASLGYEVLTALGARLTRVYRGAP